MTEPTDAELEALAVEHEAFGFGLADKQGLSTHGFDPDGLRSFARAVLAKWGTPPAVVGEPIGHLYCGGLYGDELADWEIVADQHQCDKLNEHHGALGKEAKLPIYTAPQPTQAQAEVRKQDDALIRQMMEALKQFQYRACESIHPDFVDEAITAAQVRLGEKT